MSRFLHFAAICAMFGVAAFPVYAGGRELPRLRRTAQACSIMAVVTAVIALLAMAGNMGDTWRSAFDPALLGAAITDTMVGRIWVGRVVLAIVIVGLCTVRRASKGLLPAASGGLLASVAFTGHSAIPGGGAGLAHRLADIIHLLAAGWWIGGLLALLLAADTLGDRLVVVIGRFSRIGYAAIGLLIVSGVIKTIILISPVSTLWTSTYGWVLMSKVALFGAMGVIALSNRFQITPALAAGVDRVRWTDRLRNRIAAEFALAMVVLAIVGALGAMPPPVSQ